MKKLVSFVLLACFCLGLAACGSSSKVSATADSSSSSPVASSSAADPSAVPEGSAAPAPVSTPEPTPAAPDLQPLVDSLNEEEAAQRTEDDPAVGVFEVATAANTINYKFAMSIFQYVIMMAEYGDAESLNAYNRLLDSLPGLENSLENALRETVPDINVDVLLMVDEYSGEVAALVHGGSIIYDLVNGVGTAPTDVEPILVLEELPPEVQAQLAEYAGLTSGEPAA